MKDKFHLLKSKINNNKKVIENYFFMTLTFVSSSLYGIILYPYLIRALGENKYGLYAYAFSTASYFGIMVSYGFHLPTMNELVKNKNSEEKKHEIVSAIFTARIYLQLLASLLFFSLVFSIESLRKNYEVFSLCFLSSISYLFTMDSYFHAMQKMKIITIIKMGFKLLSIPFIFIYVHSPNDLVIFVLIFSISNFLGGISYLYVLLFIEKIKIKIVRFSKLKKWYKLSFPLFINSFIAVLKDQGAYTLIANVFSLEDVALYDLANKIISIPRMIFSSINKAIFSKIIENINTKLVKKVIQYEYYIGIITMLLVALFGYWVVLFLGGEQMISAYLLSIVLSITILTWLVVGAYIYFIFIPHGMNYLVTKNQLIAAISYFILAFIGIMISKNIILFCIAMALSGIIEVLYCKYITKKEKLLVNLSKI